MASHIMSIPLQMFDSAMRSPLGSIFTEIIMQETESTVIQASVHLILYPRYLDAILITERTSNESDIMKLKEKLEKTFETNEVYN